MNKGLVEGKYTATRLQPVAATDNPKAQQVLLEVNRNTYSPLVIDAHAYA